MERPQLTPYWNKKEAIYWIIITAIVTTYLVFLALGVDLSEVILGN
jgi:hypothetical protein